MPIQDLTRREYTDFLNRLGDSGDYSKVTIRHLNSIMQGLMYHAEVNDVITKSKIKSIPVTGGTEPKSQQVTPEDFKKFMIVAEAWCTPYQFAMIQLLTLGMRRGELMGLRTGSFVFRKDEKTGKELCAIKLDRARTRMHREGTGLKTAASYRTIWVSGDMVTTIHFVLEKSDEYLVKNNKPVTENHYLWVRPDTGEILVPEYPNDIMGKISKQAGVKINPHKFRHYFATEARENGTLAYK